MIQRFAVTFFMLTTLGRACECVGDISQPTARSVAFAIFDGIVTDIHHFENEEQRKLASRELVTFKVSQSWKGPVGSTIQIHAMEKPLMCEGYTFEVGKRYVVYALERDKEGGWADQYPAGTKILVIGDCILRVRNDAAAEAKRLGKSRPSSN